MKTNTQNTESTKASLLSRCAIPQHLATVEIAAAYFADAGETPPAIRANIFKAADRTNSRGEKISGNGLEKYGAIIRRGRKVLIDLDRYAAWLAGRA